MAKPARQPEPEGTPETTSPSPSARAPKGKSVPIDTRIGFFTGLLMFMTAMTFDGAQAVLALLHGIFILGSIMAIVLSIFVGLFAMIVFMLWFALAKVQGKEKFKATLIRILIMIIMAILEVSPAGVLPWTTIGVTLTIFIVNNAKTAKDLLAHPEKLANDPELLAQLAAQGVPAGRLASKLYAAQQQRLGEDQEAKRKQREEEESGRTKRRKAYEPETPQPPSPANDNAQKPKQWF